MSGAAALSSNAEGLRDIPEPDIDTARQALWGASGVMPAEVEATLVPRMTQIIPAELLPVLYTLWQRKDLYRGRRTIIFVDNLPVCAILVKGGAREIDLQLIATYFHSFTHGFSIAWWIEWIPSLANCSDKLSRLEPSKWCSSPEALQFPDWMIRNPRSVMTLREFLLTLL